MKTFWIYLNICLVALLLIACGVLFVAFKGMSHPNGNDVALQVAQGTENEETLNLPTAVVFRIKGNALCQNDAVLVESSDSYRFTLRPLIDLPGDAPTALRTYVETHPDLEQRAHIEWKTVGGGSITTSTEGRYEFVPPKAGGDVRLAFRAFIQISTGKGLKATLSGETQLQLICPIRWELIPPKVQAMIGRYPNAKEYKHFYKRPDLWYQITEANQNLKISPHFSLGDFDLHFDYTTPKSPDLNQFPQYIALNPHLVMKLEEILTGLTERGIPIDHLGILAGYRSPGYNQWKKQQGGVGGKYTKGLSTHMYGAAADFYVDQNQDGIMDDLNGDGQSDQEDAAWVRDEVVDAVDCQAQESKSGLAGACGIYGEHDVPDRSPQTPNLHVDVRGFATPRWFINSHDQMVTDWQHWSKHPCPSSKGGSQTAPTDETEETGE